MNAKKICVVTGTRAEYGLLYWLLKALEQDTAFDLRLVVTGMHLSNDFGLTYKEIEKDFAIDEKIKILFDSDSEVAVSKSMGLGLSSFAEYFERKRPDLLILLGDRFELFAVASAALVARIPIAHIHGGETTQGAFDEAIRHSITKMSHLHFTATEEYRKRVIQLGENPKYVFNVGAMGIDNIKRLPLLSKKEFEDSIGFTLDATYHVLVTFHPVTLEDATAQEQFSQLLKALDQFEDMKIIFTKANCDTNGRIINQMIDDYVSNNKFKSIAFDSLGQLRYLSAMQYIDCVVGNSSSGLLEVPSFNIATINIGDRQKGRIEAQSVISCPAQFDAIVSSIQLGLSNEFKNKIANIVNPFGNGGASEKIKEIIKEIDLKNLIKKSFFDIEHKY